VSEGKREEAKVKKKGLRGFRHRRMTGSTLSFISSFLPLAFCLFPFAF
jgi:hypothetical protein